jgi:hypothetical protein
MLQSQLLHKLRPSSVQIFYLSSVFSLVLNMTISIYKYLELEIDRFDQSLNLGFPLLPVVGMVNQVLIWPGFAVPGVVLMMVVPIEVVLLIIPIPTLSTHHGRIHSCNLVHTTKIPRWRSTCRIHVLLNRHLPGISGGGAKRRCRRGAHCFRHEKCTDLKRPCPIPARHVILLQEICQIFIGCDRHKRIKILSGDLATYADRIRTTHLLHLCFNLC